MMKVDKNKIRLFLKWLLARKSFYKFNKFLYSLSLNSLGILNYENDLISGEASFVREISRFLDEDAVVFDVGANVGHYSNMLSELKPEIKIYAFEPHPLTFKSLEQNAQLNGYRAFQLGCGREKSQLKLYDYAEQDGSEHATFYKDVIRDIYASKPTEHSVEVIALDSFISEQNIARVALLKIDVEGNEYAVLQGLQRSLANGMIEIIHWEFNNMNVVSRTFFKDFYELLAAYQIYRMLPYGLIPLGEYNPMFCEIYAFQNLVAIHKDSQFRP
ncbi:FkbM family methyltransferase [Pleurocapsales cyanobacterium LEGE 10410]|nr:FkbM family methyltransferase [Pleurocapsales cyanobacterium LEGE 10410]